MAVRPVHYLMVRNAMKRLLALLLLAPSMCWAQGVDVTVAPATTFPNIDGTELQVHLEPSQIFWDDFTNTGGVLDTTNRWNAVTTGSGGTATATSGAYQLNSNTTAGGFAYITSQPSFPGVNPGYISIQHQINIESPVLTNSYRFWGVGTIPATPTAAAPLTDAVGFAIGTNGHLFATSWAGGTNVFNLDLSVPNQGQYLAPTAGQKFDAGIHRYQISFRGDFIQWYVDGTLIARVPNGSAGPNTNTLPVAFLSVNNTTPPTANPTLVDNLVVIGDSGRNSAAVKDGTFGWRKLTVTPSGTLLPAAPSTPVNGVFSGNTNAGAGTATLTGVAGKSTYICGWSVDSNGATAAGDVTMTVGVLTGTVTQSFLLSLQAVATTIDTYKTQVYSPCLQSNAVAGNIVVTVPQSAGNTSTLINAWGYTQ